MLLLVGIVGKVLVRQSSRVAVVFSLPSRQVYGVERL
jgi:hypothetical protein